MKRLANSDRGSNSERQLPKLRYFHPKAQEENKDKVNTLPDQIMAGKRRGRGQTKITGKTFFFSFSFWIWVK